VKNEVQRIAALAANHWHRKVQTLQNKVSDHSFT